MKKKEIIEVINEQEYKNELDIIEKRIEETYRQVYTYSNPKLIFLYYEIGSYINKHKRWGSKYILRLSNDLRHRKGMSYDSLKRMSQFARNISIQEIREQPVPQLAWGTIIEILKKNKEHDAVIWYINKTYEYGWSRSDLIKQIKAKAYERNMIEPIVSKGIKDYDNELIKSVIKANYYIPISSNKVKNEKELKDCMVNKIKEILQETGKGNAFVGEEFKIKSGNKTYYLDLLFYNYLLHAFIVIEVKIGEYKTTHLGQLKNYVKCVDQEHKSKIDNKTIGILLCKDADRIIVRNTIEDEETPLILSQYILLDKLDDYLNEKS